MWIAQALVNNLKTYHAFKLSQAGLKPLVLMKDKQFTEKWVTFW